MADESGKSTKFEEFRQFISRFISGPNADALINTLADESERAGNLSVSITDQLFISTSSGEYLDKKLGDKGITRPPELGMDDLAFKTMGIQINAVKLVPEIINTVLATFYGPEAVRAWVQSTLPEPYDFSAGMDLILQLEEGNLVTLTVQNSDFLDITQATAAEVADVVTRFLRVSGYKGFSKPIEDPDTGDKYVRIFGSAQGPYSMVNVFGGEMQNVLEFPLMRGTELQLNNTVWEITKTIGNTIRYRWTGGSQPALDKVIVGDKVMLYGSGFKDLSLDGTFRVNNVRPPKTAPAYDSGWFEVRNDTVTGLRNSLPDVAPPTNDPGNDLIYTWTVAQLSYYDLKFFKAIKTAPYLQSRYALAFEPEDGLLKIYMPATTRIVERKLKGASHLHNLYTADSLNGVFGSDTDDSQKIVVLNDYSIRYKHIGYDNYGSGGTLSYDAVNKEIAYVNRENGYTTVNTIEPHGLAGVADIHGRILSDKIVTVSVDRVPTDPEAPFLGPYMVDPEVDYTLTSVVQKTRESVRAGEIKKTLYVQGSMPNIRGRLLFDLGKDNEEGPVDYYGAQIANAPTTAPIVSISQSGTTVTVVVTKPHGAIVGSKIIISGTTAFNGLYSVISVPNSTTFKFSRTPSQTLLENSGQVILLVEDIASTLILDPSYTFKHDHEVEAEVSLVSSTKAYTPDEKGTDYASYITGTAEARIFAESLIRQITALGIRLEIIIIYPSDIGLGNEGGSASLNDPPTSDKIFVWGSDEL